MNASELEEVLRLHKLWLSNKGGAKANLTDTDLDSKKYRPKVYTVLVRVNNPLITNDNSEARSARENGFDSVIFLGDNIVDDVPEVAVFDSENIRIKSVEVGE